MLKIGEWLFDAPTLAEMPGQVWSRDALFERMWPAVTVGDEVLTHAIAEVRKALGDDLDFDSLRDDRRFKRIARCIGGLTPV